MNTVTAKEIQTEVLTSQQALIAEAVALIGQKDNKAKHSENLRALGFGGAAETLDAKVVASTELDRLVRWYASAYPGLKFIPKKAMEEVCAKYGLVVAHVERYLGDVPEWALKQIAANKHHIETMEVYDEATFNRAMRVSREMMRAMMEEDMDPRSARLMATDFDWISPADGMKTVSNLVIAAPSNEMRLDSTERVKDGRIEADPSKLVAAFDPIVCLKVDGGYIVLAAWGEEGSDPQVFNADNN